MSDFVIICKSVLLKTCLATHFRLDQPREPRSVFKKYLTSTMSCWTHDHWLDRHTSVLASYNQWCAEACRCPKAIPWFECPNVCFSQSIFSLDGPQHPLLSDIDARWMDGCPGPQPPPLPPTNFCVPLLITVVKLQNLVWFEHVILHSYLSKGIILQGM